MLISNRIIRLLQANKNLHVVLSTTFILELYTNLRKKNSCVHSIYCYYPINTYKALYKRRTLVVCQIDV